MVPVPSLSNCPQCVLALLMFLLPRHPLLRLPYHRNRLDSLRRTTQPVVFTSTSPGSQNPKRRGGTCNAHSQPRPVPSLTYLSRDLHQPIRTSRLSMPRAISIGLLRVTRLALVPGLLLLPSPLTRDSRHHHHQHRPQWTLRHRRTSETSHLPRRQRHRMTVSHGI